MQSNALCTAAAYIDLHALQIPPRPTVNISSSVLPTTHGRNGGWHDPDAAAFGRRDLRAERELTTLSRTH
jgi:hypothetical protein